MCLEVSSGCVGSAANHLLLEMKYDTDDLSLGLSPCGDFMLPIFEIMFLGRITTPHEVGLLDFTRPVSSAPSPLLEFVGGVVVCFMFRVVPHMAIFGFHASW